jgi:hypothetical protein
MRCFWCAVDRQDHVRPQPLSRDLILGIMIAGAAKLYVGKCRGFDRCTISKQLGTLVFQQPESQLYLLFVVSLLDTAPICRLVVCSQTGCLHLDLIACSYLPRETNRPHTRSSDWWQRMLPLETADVGLARQGRLDCLNAVPLEYPCNRSCSDHFQWIGCYHTTSSWRLTAFAGRIPLWSALAGGGSHAQKEAIRAIHPPDQFLIISPVQCKLASTAKGPCSTCGGDAMRPV